MYESNDKMVSHPDHYQAENGMEVIDVIEAFTTDLKGIEATDTGNIIKYILRWKNKNGLQDLEKAQWYLTHLIDRLRAKEEPLSEVEIKYSPETILNSGLCFDTQEKAEYIIARLGDIIDVYGYATVADLNDLVGKLSTKNTCNYGWLSTNGMKVEKTKYGYVANLPNAILLPKDEIELPDFEVKNEEKEIK